MKTFKRLVVARSEHRALRMLHSLRDDNIFGRSSFEINNNFGRNDCNLILQLFCLQLLPQNLLCLQLWPPNLLCLQLLEPLMLGPCDDTKTSLLLGLDGTP